MTVSVSGAGAAPRAHAVNHWSASHPRYRHFEAAVWTIPKSRMKGRRPHNVYLSQQALDIMVTLHTCAAGSRYVLPSRYDQDRCMSRATLNRVTQLIVERAKAASLPLESFTVHDLRYHQVTLSHRRGGMSRDYANDVFGRPT